METFEKINSAKTGFHNLPGLGVPPVNLNRERKPLQWYCQQHFHSYKNYLIESFEKINSAKTGLHHLRSLGVPPVNLMRERKPLQ